LALAVHKRKFSAFGSGPSTPNSFSLPSTPTGVPTAKRRHIAVKDTDSLGSAAAMVGLQERMDDFTDAFRSATSGQASMAPESSPVRRRRAIRKAQELENDLDDADLVVLVNLFIADVSAADGYMELQHEGLQKAWVAQRLGQL
jgi:tellurite resistance protein